MEHAVSRVKALRGNHPAGDVICAHRAARSGSEHAKAEPRQFIPGEVPVAAIGALRADCLRVKISHENAEHAVDMHQVRPVLIKLPLQLVNNAGKLRSLRDQGGNDMIPCGGHDALRCQ